MDKEKRDKLIQEIVDDFTDAFQKEISDFLHKKLSGLSLEIIDDVSVEMGRENEVLRQMLNISDETLTTREREISEFISSGKTNKEIGNILSISEFTVKNHIRSIYSKMGVSNRAQLAAVWTKNHKSKVKNNAAEKSAPVEDTYWSMEQIKKDIIQLLTSKNAEKIIFIQGGKSPDGMIVGFEWKGVIHTECSSFRDQTLNLRQIYFALKKFIDFENTGVTMSIGGI